MKMGIGLVTALFMVACASNAIDGNEVGDNTLGVTRVDIEHQVADGGRVLLVHALDDQGKEVATARVFSGSVEYAMDGADTPTTTDGVELSLQVGDATFTEVSPNHLAYTIRARMAASLRELVAVPDVAHAIDAEAGITFAPRPLASEIRETAYYYAGPCPGAAFPTNQGSPYTCIFFIYDDFTVETDHNQSNGGTYFDRTGLPQAPGCRDQAGNAGTYYGPCGFHANGAYGTGNMNYGGPTAQCTCTGCNNGSPTPGGCYHL